MQWIREHTMAIEAESVVEKLLATSQKGKVPWEATADDHTYIVTLKGSTFKIYTVRDENGFEVPVLSLTDESGKEIWRHTGKALGYYQEPIGELWSIAQRIGDKVDEKLNAAI